MNTKTTRSSAFAILSLLGILAFSGCSQKVSDEEIAAKVKAELAKEKAAEHGVREPASEAGRVAHEKAVPAESERKVACDNCGVVVSVKEIEQEGKGSGLGVIAGGVAGGIIGNQVGQGTGRDLATLAGLVGGAFAGNTVEKKIKKTNVYDVTVKLGNGEERVIRYTTAPGVMAGDMIKVEGEKIVRQ
ncbi:glycine zipper 2TM domain-containing protein [Sideroxydans sp. CL21]|uniref:glycine zipper 2TM domain-containing protein n=1 Tax=Sideroxydans sp. CL21 TaxID=2600596 RepID=UPI0024BC72BD|nr:glycine zipper 2TM domain-containing protein [Sideroxydans sp. CL21]